MSAAIAELLTWVEGSGLGRLMRESGPWTYAFVNLTHVFGIALLFGSIVLLDLRLLGVWRRVPLAAIADVASPAAATGLVIALISGLGLITANGSEYIGNPFLYVKFPAIAIGVTNALVLRGSRAWRARHQPLTPHHERQLAIMGAVSLGSWMTAIGAGRLLGYW